MQELINSKEFTEININTSWDKYEHHLQINVPRNNFNRSELKFHLLQARLFDVDVAFGKPWPMILKQGRFKVTDLLNGLLSEPLKKSQNVLTNGRIMEEVIPEDTGIEKKQKRKGFIQFNLPLSPIRWMVKKKQKRLGFYSLSTPEFR